MRFGAELVCLMVRSQEEGQIRRKEKEEERTKQGHRLTISTRPTSPAIYPRLSSKVHEVTFPSTLLDLLPPRRQAIRLRQASRGRKFAFGNDGTTPNAGDWCVDQLSGTFPLRETGFVERVAARGRAESETGRRVWCKVLMDGIGKKWVDERKGQ